MKILLSECYFMHPKILSFSEGLECTSIPSANAPTLPSSFGRVPDGDVSRKPRPSIDHPLYQPSALSEAAPLLRLLFLSATLTVCSAMQPRLS